MISSIGLIEISSIASGFQVSDAMLKASSVDLLLSRTICSGKYIVMVSGNVGDVTASVETGIATASHAYIEHFVIPNVHEDVLKAIRGVSETEAPDALGIIESFSVASLIEGADAAVKSANVSLHEIRIAMAMGGKAFALITGSVADVESAVETGARVIGEHGMLVNKIVIPRPHEQLFEEVI